MGGGAKGVGDPEVADRLRKGNGKGRPQRRGERANQHPGAPPRAAAVDPCRLQQPAAGGRQGRPDGQVGKGRPLQPQQRDLPKRPEDQRAGRGRRQAGPFQDPAHFNQPLHAKGKQVAWRQQQREDKRPPEGAAVRGEPLDRPGKQAAEEDGQVI